MMKLTKRLQTRVEDPCQAVIDDEHPVSVEAVGDQKPRVFKGSCQPGDEGLMLGAPGRQGTDSHGHQRLTPILACEKPLPAAGTRVVRAADESARAGAGAGHD
jgi:hypothetical protein